MSRFFRPPLRLLGVDDSIRLDFVDLERQASRFRTHHQTRIHNHRLELSKRVESRLEGTRSCSQMISLIPLLDNLTFVITVGEAVHLDFLISVVALIDWSFLG